MSAFERTLHVLVGLLFAPLHLATALAVRPLRARRRRNGQRPRIVWGPTPIHGTHYYSKACREVGYESGTWMFGTSPLGQGHDMDATHRTLFPRLTRLKGSWLVVGHLMFLRSLVSHEIHFHNFDRGFLRATPLLWRHEVRLRRLSGGRTIVYPYGGDGQVLPRLRDPVLQQALMRDYPRLARDWRRTAASVDHFAYHADFVYAANEAPDYLPRWDLLLMDKGTIDTDHVDPARFSSGPLRARHGDKKIIFHAPNHRTVKGTDLLIAACEELRRSGRDDFELVIYEGRSNEDVLQAMHDADIVVDQLIMGTYALFAMEGMAMEKPVVIYLRPDLRELYARFSWADQCPLVHTERAALADTLVSLLDDPTAREAIGRAGRTFILGHHSIPAMGRLYDLIIRHVWDGDQEVLALSRLRAPLAHGGADRSAGDAAVPATHFYAATLPTVEPLEASP